MSRNLNYSGPTPPSTPTLDKLTATYDRRAEVTEFLGYLRNRELRVCEKIVDGDDGVSYDPLPERKNEQLAAEYLGINWANVEKERRELLEWQQRRASAAHLTSKPVPNTCPGCDYSLDYLEQTYSCMLGKDCKCGSK